MEAKRIDVGPGRPIWAMGLMSGTSMDGVDAAMVLTDGETLSEFGPSSFTPANADDFRALEMITSNWQKLRPPRTESLEACLARAENSVVQSHARAVIDTLVAPAFTDGAAMPEVIGFHGQTVAHAPEDGWTWQLGNGEALARTLNRTTVWDFRSADMRAGGQGAPLAPFYHHALARLIAADRPLAFLNIGGVANVTWVDPTRERPEEAGALLAFDTGPGNALVNDWMLARTGEALDRDGACAAEGEVQWSRLQSNYGTDYLGKPGPKSLDRNDFHGFLDAMEGISTRDGAATLTAFTAECVAASGAQMPAPPSRWLICGGGRLNPTLMGMLAARLEAPVEPVEAVGLDGDMLEAQAFAYLAVRVLRGLPTSAPSTTGCDAPVSGGRISYSG